MDIITVLTCPSKRDRYVEKTLAGLDREGAIGRDRMRFVCCDGPAVRPGGSPFRPLGWPMFIKEDGPSGVRHAMWWIFNRFVSCHGDRLLYCEDDLDVGVDAVNRALNVVIPDDVAFVNFFDQREAGTDTKDGLYPIPVNASDDQGLWGTQMVLIPRRTVDFLLQRAADGWGDPWPESRDHGDCVMSWVLSRFSPWKKYLMHIPSLADHMGVESSLQEKRIRRAVRFVGARQPYHPLPKICAACLTAWPCAGATPDCHPLDCEE